MGRLFTVGEVAHRLGLCRATIFRMMKRGELPSVAVTPKTVRVAEADLNAFLASRRRSAA